METWQGQWEFRNFHMRQDGRKGTTTVSASSEDAAREAVKEKASQELFGTTSWKTYVQVTHLVNVPKLY